jgi:DNA-binding NtrC family response regulator
MGQSARSNARAFVFAIAAQRAFSYAHRMAKILVVDDEITMIQITSELLRAEGHEVFPCNNVEAALGILEAQKPDLVITDLYLEKSKPVGLTVLARARAMNPPAVVIIITGFATVPTAVEAMKTGAFDYLQKPFNLEDFKLTIRRALSYNEAVSENVFLKKQLKQQYRFDQIVGLSPKMQEVFKMVERVADTDSTVLILGESGTGKELVARALHFNSRRQFAPFVPINCAALPENLLESELFGHCKGAFTGAVNDKKGLFEEAEGGTIFLDEIASMPALLQSRLLRVLQDREVRRVGENTAIRVNVRVLAATNEPLEKRIRDGLFREDLYYRLNVIPISLPPLRERRDDVPLLVARFLRDKIHGRTGQPFQVTRQAMAALTAYDWPGNVRELENAMERASVLSDTEIIKLDSLPPAITAVGRAQPPDQNVTDTKFFAFPAQEPAETNGRTATSSPVPGPLTNLKSFMREQELTYINRALTQSGGDKEKAAKLLGISLATLYRRLSGEE